jgi:hypothetical protein
MAKRIINGVLDNFLGTFTSRYSDYSGYWVFGMMVEEFEGLKFNLLSSVPGKIENSPLGAARLLAAQKFQEQLAKADLPLSYAHEASVEIRKLPEATTGFVNGRRCPGWIFEFTAKVVTESGYAFTRAKSVFVAPHDPDVERRCVAPI